MTSSLVLSKKKTFFGIIQDDEGEDTSPEAKQHFMMHRMVTAQSGFKNTVSIENCFAAIMFNEQKTMTFRKSQQSICAQSASLVVLNSTSAEFPPFFKLKKNGFQSSSAKFAQILFL